MLFRSNATDSSKRITYRHFLGRPLAENNSGRMQWGVKYRKLHEKVYVECKRLLKTDGIILINISNHIRKGEEIDVVSWHRTALLALGFVVKEEIEIPTPRMGFGANNKLRVANEYILIFQKIED